MTTTNVPENTTALPDRARLPRDDRPIDQYMVLAAAGVGWQEGVTLDQAHLLDSVIEAAAVAADEITEARQRNGRHGEQTALVEIGALLIVTLATTGNYRSPRPGDPVLHATSSRRRRCSECGHHWDEHTRSIEGASGCVADDEAAMGGCGCPGFRGQ